MATEKQSKANTNPKKEEKKKKHDDTIQIQKRFLPGSFGSACPFVASFCVVCDALTGEPSRFDDSGSESVRWMRFSLDSRWAIGEGAVVVALASLPAEVVSAIASGPDPVSWACGLGCDPVPSIGESSARPAEELLVAFVLEGDGLWDFAS
jgi:hypothetical protein